MSLHCINSGTTEEFQLLEKTKMELGAAATDTMEGDRTSSLFVNPHAKVKE